MSASPFFLAQETLFERVGHSWRTMSGSMHDAIVIVGTSALVIGFLMIWVLYFRGRRHDHHHHHHHHHHRGAAEAGSANESSSALPVEDSPRKRRRRRRRGHRPRNPTLAETGGLPPIRSGPPPGPVP